MTTGLRLEGNAFDPALPLPCDGGRRGSPRIRRRLCLRGVQPDATRGTARTARVRGENVVVASAPTASGKTALAELAICKALADGGTALFIAPMRALTNEKEDDWDRFEDLEYSVYVVTGERDLNPGARVERTSS